MRALQLPDNQPSTQVTVVVVHLLDVNLRGADPRVTPIYVGLVPFSPHLLHASRLQHNLVSAHELFSCLKRPRFQDTRGKQQKTKQSETSQSVQERKLLEALLCGSISISVTVVGVAPTPGTPNFSPDVRDLVASQVRHNALIQLLLHEDWPLGVSEPSQQQIKVSPSVHRR
jgi:hypothetical protein